MKVSIAWQQTSYTYSSLALYSSSCCVSESLINYSVRCIRGSIEQKSTQIIVFSFIQYSSAGTTAVISSEHFTKRRMCLTLNRRRMLATMMETELEEAPMTPTTLSGLVMMGAPPPRHLTSDPSFSIRACTKVSDCSRAWVSLEQVSRIRAPSVMLGSRLLSLLMRSRAKSMASSLCMPFSFFSSPHGLPSWPLACTGKSPPKEISPSMRMEFKCVCPGPLGLAAWAALREL